MPRSIAVGGFIVAWLGLILLPTAAVAAEAPAIKPILDARLRYERVEQAALDADALTLRVRAGAEASVGRLTFLAEGEGTLALDNDYNAFPFVIADEQRRPQFAGVSDPENLELNRFQLQYNSKNVAVTVGRQRINLDDQRWIGSVGWRQNEQTFDAARGEAALGPIRLDLVYAISQRTIFGEDAGARAAIAGKFVFAGVGSSAGAVQGKLFSYLLDYDEDFALANSSQTYGGYVTGAVPLGQGKKLTLRASYARQSDYGRNPFNYAADYWSLEGGSALAGVTIAAGWEKLGSDNGRGVQSPLATLHKFNGWADLFLSTPPAGLGDTYLSIGKTFGRVNLLPGLNANVIFHQFDSTKGDIEYGTEWDASVGFRWGKAGVLAKFADYDAKAFGVDTRKMWLQVEWAL